MFHHKIPEDEWGLQDNLLVYTCAFSSLLGTKIFCKMSISSIHASSVVVNASP